MPGNTRKIVVAGVLGAITIFLGLTPLGLIPWIAGASLTIMHVPAIVGAILEGPWVGFAVGLVFGAFSLFQAAVAPRGPTDVWFTNPLVSIAPRLLIGPVAWAVHRAITRFSRQSALFAAGLAGSLTNTVLVLSVLGLYRYISWQLVTTIALTNGVPEAIAAAIITYAVVAAWTRLETGRRGSTV
jgi:uncharacterized membrane protein